MEIIRTISPVDGSIYVERPYADVKQIEQALKLASDAQASWAALPLSKKSQIMQGFIDYFREHQQEIATEITGQMGRPIRYSPGEINGLIERTEYMVSIAESALIDRVPAKKAHYDRFIRREPLGVVCVIAPWNYPYLTAINAIIPALMAGNVIILKSSSQTPLCAERFSAAFSAAGLPEGVFQYLHMTHTDTEKMLQDSRIQFVAFTGSVASGAKMEKNIAGRFIGYGLELGGKDPAYVRADADLGFSVESLLEGVFFNSGQSCCGIERIYVAKAIYPDFVEHFVQGTLNYKLGDPTLADTTLGPLAKIDAGDLLREQIVEAVSQGAKTLVDESHFPASRQAVNYLAPQVLVDVNHQMRLMTEENFGPVVGIMPVESDEQAVELMNDSQYGLTASVWTQDKTAALRLGAQVQTGTWFMNRCDYLDPGLAWTGVKNSGHGLSLSVLGYEQLTQAKSYHLRLR